MLFVAGNIDLWNQNLSNYSQKFASVDAVITALGCRGSVVRVETDPGGTGGSVDLVFDLQTRTCSMYRIRGGSRVTPAESVVPFPVKTGCCVIM